MKRFNIFPKNLRNKFLNNMTDNTIKLKELADKAYALASKKVNCLPSWPLSSGRSFSRYKVNKVFTRFLMLL
ncbi:hypothetical protein C4577_04450 [Candidatus Parcubacteria bacterium]|nr:MAG: hypothetical protein C4577_04450 [Candidatus Parcubacteria bacterium]